MTSTDVIESIKNGFDIDQVAFLMNETKKSIDLVSSFMFTTEKCRHNQLSTINWFDGRRKSWKTQDFYPKKYRNFHNCSLSAVMKVAAYPEFTDLIASVVNFSFEMRKMNYTAMYSAADIDVIRGISLLYVTGFKLSEIVSTPIFLMQMFPILPTGDPYTQLQKMWMMFQTEVWIAIGAFLLLWLVSIQIINLTSKDVQKFVYGQRITTPTMNMLSLFLNGYQRKVPGRNFARFILVLMIIWCLIIRTCYQSMLFGFLQSDLRQSTSYESLEDLESNRTDLTRESNDLDPFESLDIVAEYSNKKYHINLESDIDTVYKKEYRSGVPSLQIFPHPIMNLFWVHTFPEFSPYTEDFNELLGRIVSSGFNDNWKMFEEQITFKKKEIEEIGPQVLTMDHLSVGFIACCCPLVLSLLAFVMEVTIFATAVSSFKVLCKFFVGKCMILFSRRCKKHSIR